MAVSQRRSADAGRWFAEQVHDSYLQLANTQISLTQITLAPDEALRIGQAAEALALLMKRYPDTSPAPTRQETGT